MVLFGPCWFLFFCFYVLLGVFGSLRSFWVVFGPLFLVLLGPFGSFSIILDPLGFFWVLLGHFGSLGVFWIFGGPYKYLWTFLNLLLVLVLLGVFWSFRSSIAMIVLVLSVGSF